jgi:menaquinone-9 beta-reductase
MRSTDIFIIGGGPAGLAAAIAASQRGFEVIVADGARPPIDKPCGEGLLPHACAALARLGITVPVEDSHPFRGIKFVGEGISVDASFPVGTGIGVRRPVLHRLMMQKAQSAGISMLWRTPVTGLHPEGVRLGNDVIRARWVIGADGGSSFVRNWAGLECSTGRKRFAFRQHFRVPPWNDYMEVHWGPKSQIYVTPVGAEEICIAVASCEPNLRLDRALAEFPEIALKMRGAACLSRERGAISSICKMRKVYRGHIALVGDASGSVDCITGEGLGLAFRQADLLAECLLRNDLMAYQRGHAALARRPALQSRLLLMLGQNSSLRRSLMRAFNAQPRLFSRMVAMHVGALRSVDCATSALTLGWRMLFA